MCGQLGNLSQPLILFWFALLYISVDWLEEFICLFGVSGLTGSLLDCHQQVTAFCHPLLRLETDIAMVWYTQQVLLTMECLYNISISSTVTLVIDSQVTG